MIQTFTNTGSYSSAGAVVAFPTPQKSPSGGNRLRFVLKHLSVSSIPAGALTSGVNQVFWITMQLGNALTDTMTWTCYLMSPTGTLKGIGTLDLDFGKDGLIAGAPPNTDTQIAITIAGDNAATTDNYFFSATYDYI